MSKNGKSFVHDTIKSIFHGGIYGFGITLTAAFIGIPPAVSARIGNIIAIASTAEQIASYKSNNKENATDEK